MNKENFVMLLTNLSKAFRTTIDEGTIAVYYEFLKDIDENTLKTACKKIIETKTRFPAVAEIRQEVAKHKNPTLSLNAEDEWDEVKKAIRNFDIYDSENALASLKPITRRALGMTCSWYELCTRPVEETKWMRKDFIAIFNREIGKTEQTEMLNAGEEQKRLNYE